VLNQIKGLVDRVVGTDEEVGAGAGQLVRGREHEFGHSCPIVGVNALHIFGERVRVQRDFGMIVDA